MGNKSIGEDVWNTDDGLREMVMAALCSPTGYAYIRTACTAAMMRVSLATTWKNHGKALLDRMYEEMERQQQGATQ